MGQYHYLVNFDRKEIVHPHKLGLGLKQVEHTGCPASLSDVLYMLVTTSPAAGGGDLKVNEDHDFESFGRWVGDRVTVFGDYTEVEPFCRIEKMCDSDWMDHHECINSYIHSFRDISEELLPAISEAFGVSFLQYEGGYTESKLNPSHWGWLFPQLLDDEKTAKQS